MSIQNINNIYLSSMNLNKNQNPSFGALHLTPDVERFCPQEVRMNLEKLTKGLDVFITSEGTKDGTGKILACEMQNEDTATGFFSTVKSIAQALVNVSVDHSHMDCAEKLVLVPRLNSEVLNIHANNGVYISDTQKSNPIELLVNRTLQHFKTPTDNIIRESNEAPVLA